MSCGCRYDDEEDDRENSRWDKRNPLLEAIGKLGCAVLTVDQMLFVVRMRNLTKLSSPFSSPTEDDLKQLEKILKQAE